MIAGTRISLAAVAAAFVGTVPAAALSLVPPIDCQDGETSYELTQALEGGLIYTRAYTGGDEASVEWLVSCEAGKGVRAIDNASSNVSFQGVVEPLMASSETYTFEDVAKLAREVGHEARVAGFSKASCICTGAW